MKPERLSPLDSSYLSMDGPVTVGHVCILCPFDGPVSMEEFRQRVEERIDRVPAMRRKLQTTLVGLGRPWWVDDPDFDLDQHLFEVTLSGGGDDLELSKHVARIATGRLNRAHPLWEFHLIQGLSGGASALVTKIHHAVMDGIGARNLLYDIFGEDSEPTGSGAAADDAEAQERWAPGPWPSELELVYRSLLDTQGWLGTVARVEYLATSALVSGAEKAIDGLTQGVTGLLRRRPREETQPEPTTEEPDPDAGKPDRSWWSIAPESIINGPVSAARSYTFGSRAMPQSRPLRHATGTTINDLVIAATAGGLRSWMLEAGALPDQPLVAMIPIGGRAAPGREEIGGNKLALTLCTVPTHLHDPFDRLIAAHEAMVRAKTTPSLPEAVLEDMMRVSAPGLTSLTVEAFYRLNLGSRVRFPYNLIITNVPGSARALGVGTAQVTGLHPCPPLSDTMSLNLAAHGYQDRLCFGISACPDMIPDVAHLMELILIAHDQLLELVPHEVDRPGNRSLPEPPLEDDHGPAKTPQSKASRPRADSSPRAPRTPRTARAAGPVRTASIVAPSRSRTATERE